MAGGCDTLSGCEHGDRVGEAGSVAVPVTGDSQGMNGKGSKVRPMDWRKYRREWDRIFQKPGLDAKKSVEIQKHEHQQKGG